MSLLGYWQQDNVDSQPVFRSSTIWTNNNDGFLSEMSVHRVLHDSMNQGRTGGIEITLNTKIGQSLFGRNEFTVIHMKEE